MRLFAAVVPPAAVLDSLAAVVDPVRDDELRWTFDDGWHVTLAFYGEVADAKVAELSRRLARGARRHPTFGMSLAAAGRFGRSVLWIGVRGEVDPLRRLAATAAAVGRRVGVVHDEDRRYRPHLTLARAASSGADLRPYVEALSAYEGPAWTVERIALVRSHLAAAEGRRARYETLEEYPLGAITTPSPAPRPRASRPAPH